jgi:hypothetical protein
MAMDHHWPYFPEKLGPDYGQVDSLEEAKAALRERYDRWLQWVTELGHNVVWYVEQQNGPPC